MRLSDLLRERRDRILDDWEAALRASATESASFSREDLRDDIPKFVDRLIAWLEGDSLDTSRAVDQETTGAHARHRLRLGVGIDHLIGEYRCLRQVLMRHVRECGVAVPFDEIVRLNDAIDHATGETVVTYITERDASRDLLLGIIGHDLRNPLGAVVMASQSVASAQSLEAARSGAERIGRSADRMQRMISDLLDLARSRFGAEMPVRPEPVDLGEVVRNNVEELQLVHPGRQLQLETRGNLHGRWDRVRIAQLISNLVGNALQHGSDPIGISAEADDGDVILQVTNKGERIPPDVVTTLFDPFRRCGETGNNSNLGLGLFIVSEIVRRHGGRIDVRSDEDQTAFVVRLPRRPEMVTEETPTLDLAEPPLPA